jgi:hypothetical protein
LIPAGRGHIWVRSTKPGHSFTANGYCWIYASADSSIETNARTLHVSFVDATWKGEYIVAILDNEREPEYPEPLGGFKLSWISDQSLKQIRSSDLASSINGTDCCPFNCTSLSIHLDRIWPNRLITKSCRLDGKDVSSGHLNDTCFRHLTNDLYLRYQDRPSNI